MNDCLRPFTTVSLALPRGGAAIRFRRIPGQWGRLSALRARPRALARGPPARLAATRAIRTTFRRHGRQRCAFGGGAWSCVVIRPLRLRTLTCRTTEHQGQAVAVSYACELMGFLLRFGLDACDAPCTSFPVGQEPSMSSDVGGFCFCVVPCSSGESVELACFDVDHGPCLSQMGVGRRFPILR